MSAGLFALLDDIATLVKVSASSVDDVAGAAAKASGKAAGVVIDDAAVTPQYVTTISAERELGVIKHIAFGSIRNKLFIILPAALILSTFAEWALPILLICGGLFLAFEGGEKVLTWFGVHLHAHDHTHSEVVSPDEDLIDPNDPEEPTKRERKLINGAVKTDLVLSTEIMLISLSELEIDSFWGKFFGLAMIAFIMTFVVYGTVALLVRIDDLGLLLMTKDSPFARSTGRLLVNGMPRVLSIITIIGTIAMLWVGGHLLLANSYELGLHEPYALVHHIEHELEHLGGIVLWFVETLCAAFAGLLAGLTLVGALMTGKRR